MIYYEPRYIYAVSYSMGAREYIHFSWNREEVVEEVYKTPHKIFYLLERCHLETCPYYCMVSSKCRFYPERMEEDFIPEQEFLPVDPARYLINREISRRTRVELPKLYFWMYYYYNIIYVSLSTEKREFKSKYHASGEVLWGKQDLKWS